MNKRPNAAIQGEPMLFLAFLNRCILVKTGLINTKLEDFVNLGVLFLTMLINSCALIP